VRLIVCICSVLFISSIKAQKVNTPLEKGDSKEGKRIGIWEYYDTPKKPALIIDYDRGKILHVEPDTAAVLVWRNNKWVREKLAVPCRPHGSWLIWSEYWGGQKDFIFRLKGSYSIIFDVWEDGTASLVKVDPDPGEGAKKLLENAFYKAPNYWISGVGLDNNPVRVRNSMTFHVCYKDCPKAPENIHKLVLTNENSALQFSPDGSKLLIEAPSPISHKKSQNMYIIKTNDLTIKTLPYQQIVGSSWLNSEDILFKYNYLPYLSGMTAIYYGAEDKVITVADSVLYFHTLNLLRTKLAFCKNERDGIGIFIQDLNTGRTKKVNVNPSFHQHTLGWSPDDSHLILDRTIEDKKHFVVYNLATGKEEVLPDKYRAFCGWAQDSSEMYVGNIDIREYSSVGQIFKYNLQSKKLIEVSGKIANLYQAAYNATVDLFLFRIKDRLYIGKFSANNQDKKEIARDVKFAHWSNDGKRIAYITEGWKVFLFDLETETIRNLAEWNKKLEELVRN
jgi:Tol biopolymer transport system component